mmetsp:Transcript_39786/g.131687  ORF Transcript_39786/g.131687 Transcript_39786/m.131687 type:complete len:679 (+) Transcript_39786:694-2730(+)
MGLRAEVTAQDMEDTFLPAFEAGVESAHAVGLMCSYSAPSFGGGLKGSNAADGSTTPSCANRELLTGLARRKWGFDGYVVSDCGGVAAVEARHHYTSGRRETVMAVLSAGMDLDCGRYMRRDTMLELLGDATLAGLVDRALERLVAVQMRLGFFDARERLPMGWGLLGAEVVDSEAHRALAKEAADQSLVLLKNERATLPLATATVTPRRKVAVIGRHANATTSMQGDYFGEAPFLISPCHGIASVVGHAAVLCDDAGSDSGRAVIDQIRSGGVGGVVLTVGLGSMGYHPKEDRDETEGHDRTSLLLPGGQDYLVAATSTVAAEEGLPVVVVVLGGGPLDLSAAKASPHVGAIIYAGYPGQAGGAAIADAIFGHTNPAGRLTMTWYPEDFVRQAELSDHRMRPQAASGYPGRSHRFFTGSPVFPFGTGLSYTRFAVGRPIVELPAGALAEVALEARRGVTRHHSRVVGLASVTVENTGDREGAHALMLYAAPPLPEAERLLTGAPKQTLVDFATVRLIPGESTTVRIELRAHDLTYASKQGQRITISGLWRFWTGTADESDKDVGTALLNMSTAVPLPPSAKTADVPLPPQPALELASSPSATPQLPPPPPPPPLRQRGRRPAAAPPRRASSRPRPSSRRRTRAPPQGRSRSGRACAGVLRAGSGRGRASRRIPSSPL